MKTYTLGAGQFVEFIVTPERNETWRWCELQKYKFRMKTWSSQCLLQFKQLQINLKKVFGTSTGFKPRPSALALQWVLYHLSYEDLHIGSSPICWVHLNWWKEWNMEHAFNLILSFLVCFAYWTSAFRVMYTFCRLIYRSFTMPVIRWDHSCLD